MKLIIFVSSVIIAVLSCTYYYKEIFGAEWRKYQIQYKQKLINYSKTSKEKLRSRKLPVRIQQIYLPETEIVDRCISCHTGIVDPRMVHLEIPFQAHPEKYLQTHDVELFGCTPCHDGQGRAITSKEAHAISDHLYWDKPILSPPFIQANCYQCHKDTIKETPFYNRGKQLFESSGCLGCHKFQGKGGYLAPELEYIGDVSFAHKYPLSQVVKEKLKNTFNQNRNLGYIYESIKDPSANTDSTVMIDFAFTDSQIVDIVVFLKSFVAPFPNKPFIPEIKKAPQSMKSKGSLIFYKYCVVCHGQKGQGGIENFNYIKNTIPALNLLAEKMFLKEKDDIDIVVRNIEQFGDLGEVKANTDIDNFNRVHVQYTNIQDLITKGNIAGKLDTLGPQPINMPTWGKTISKNEINGVIGYLLSLYEPMDDDEW